MAPSQHFRDIPGRTYNVHITGDQNPWMVEWECPYRVPEACHQAIEGGVARKNICAAYDEKIIFISSFHSICLVAKLNHTKGLWNIKIFTFCALWKFGISNSVFLDNPIYQSIVWSVCMHVCYKLLERQHQFISLCYTSIRFEIIRCIREVFWISDCLHLHVLNNIKQNLLY